MCQNIFTGSVIICLSVAAESDNTAKMAAHLTSISTIFQPYKGDGSVIMMCNEAMSTMSMMCN